MTAERIEFEEWIDNPSVLQLNECPSQEPDVVSAWEANPYQDPWTAAAWEGWKARGRLEDEEDREEAKRHRKRKPQAERSSAPRSEAQEPQEGLSEPTKAPLEPTTPQEANEGTLEAPLEPPALPGTPD